MMPSIDSLRPEAAPLPSRNQMLKVLGQHTWNALKHGAISARHAASWVAHGQVSSYSRPASALAHAHGRAAEMTGPLARNEGATAKAHLLATAAAVRDLLFKTRTYDTGAVAQTLSWLKMQHGLEQDLKKIALAASPEAASEVAALREASASARSSHGAEMRLTARPHAAAARAAAAAVGHAVAGTYHKAMEGMHVLGANAWDKAPALSHAHCMARALHSSRAAVSFADASVQAKHAMHYATVSAHEQAAQAAKAWARQGAKLRQSVLAHGLSGIGEQAKAAWGRMAGRLERRRAQWVRQMLSPRAIQAAGQTPRPAAQSSTGSASSRSSPRARS